MWFLGVLMAVVFLSVAIGVGYVWGKITTERRTNDVLRSAHDSLFDASVYANSQLTALEHEQGNLERNLDGLIRLIDTKSQLRGVVVPRGPDTCSPFVPDGAPPLDRLAAGHRRLESFRQRHANMAAGLQQVVSSFKSPPARPDNPPPRPRDEDRDVLVNLPPPRTEAADAPRPFSSQPTSGVAQLIDLYNRAMDDRGAADQFREELKPIRIGTTNAVDRRHNLRIAAEFAEAGDGEFFAIPGACSGEYWVVPRFGLIIEAVNYSAGAVGEVFGRSRGHDPQLHYSRYRIESPARFARAGGRWVLIEPGRLHLGSGT